MHIKFIKIHIVGFLIIFSCSSLSIPYQFLPTENTATNAFRSLSTTRKAGVLTCGATTVQYAECYISLRPMKYGYVRTFDLSRYEVEVNIDSTDTGTFSINPFSEITETVFDRASPPTPHCSSSSSMFHGADVDYLKMSSKPLPNTMSIDFIITNSVGYENTSTRYFYNFSRINPSISSLQVPVTYLKNEPYDLNVIGRHTGLAVVNIDDNILAAHNCPNAHYYDGNRTTIF